MVFEVDSLVGCCVCKDGGLRFGVFMSYATKRFRVYACGLCAFECNLGRRVLRVTFVLKFRNASSSKPRVGAVVLTVVIWEFLKNLLIHGNLFMLV